MCYHKSEVVNYTDLTAHFSASPEGVKEELSPIQERLENLMQIEDLQNAVKQEIIAELNG